MNFIEVMNLKSACSLLSDACVSRNAMVGWADKEAVQREEEYIIKLIASLKDKIEIIEKGVGE